MKEFLQVMSILGFPSVVFILGWVINLGKKIKILMKAQQAQMRTQLIQQYNYHMDNGFISDDDLDDWENQYQSYHALGQNGILDSKRSKLLELPNKPMQV